MIKCKINHLAYYNFHNQHLEIKNILKKFFYQLSRIMDEGYIKYQIFQNHILPDFGVETQTLLEARNMLFKLKLIGAYQDGTGYGNMSLRIDNSLQFIITGSKTGHIPVLTNKQLVLVSSTDLQNNSLHCEGIFAASSESLTHAAFYQVDNHIKSVIHVHHQGFWKHFLHQLPTTSKSILYGTQQMADEVFRLMHSSDLPEKKIMLTEGHADGVFIFGESVQEAFDICKNYFNQINIG